MVRTTLEGGPRWKSAATSELSAQRKRAEMTESIDGATGDESAGAPVAGAGGR